MLQHLHTSASKQKKKTLNFKHYFSIFRSLKDCFIKYEQRESSLTPEKPTLSSLCNLGEGEGGGRREETTTFQSRGRKNLNNPIQLTDENQFHRLWPQACRNIATILHNSTNKEKVRL